MSGSPNWDQPQSEFAPILPLTDAPRPLWDGPLIRGVETPGASRLVA